MRRVHVKPEILEIQRNFISEVVVNAKFRSDARDGDFSNAFTLKDNALYYD